MRSAIASFSARALLLLLVVCCLQGSCAGRIRPFSMPATIPAIKSRGGSLVASRAPPSPAAVTAAANPLPSVAVDAAKPVLFPALAASFCTAALLYPLELLNALKMAGVGGGTSVLSTRELIAHFKEAHGVLGFFLQGLVPHVARSTLMNFVAFALFPPLHQLMFRRGADSGNGLTRALVGSIVTIPEVVSIMPLEIAKLALQLDDAHRYGNSMLAVLRSLYSRYGLRLFGVGYIATQYKHATWTGLYFATLPYFERLVGFLLFPLRSRGDGADAPLQHRGVDAVMDGLGSMLAGFLAGAVGALANRPGDTLRTIIQKRCFASPDLIGGGGLRGNLKVLRDVLDGPLGWRGLYAGIGIKTVSMGAAGALMALFIPFFESFYINYIRRSSGSGASSL